MLGRLRPCAACLLVAVAACSPGAFASQDEAAVRAVLDQQRDAWNRGDLESFMRGYHHDPKIVFTSSGKIRRGYDETLQSYRKRYDSGEAKMGVLDFRDIEVTGLATDAAMAMGHFVLTETPQASDGVFSLVFTRREGTWGIVHDHSSVRVPPDDPSGPASAKSPNASDGATPTPHE